MTPLRPQKGCRWGARALPICRDCVMAAHETEWLSVAFVFERRRSLGREADRVSKSGLEDSVFSRDFLVCRFVFTLCVQGKGRDFLPRWKRLRLGFWRDESLARGISRLLEAKRGGAFIFFRKKSIFFLHGSLDWFFLFSVIRNF